MIWFLPGAKTSRCLPLLLVSVVLCGLAGGAFCSDAHAQSSNDACPDPSSLTATVDSVRRAASVPGVSVTPLRGGRVCPTMVSGVVNTQTNTPVVDTTKFEAASLTKPVVAYLTLRRAAEEGVLLDVPYSLPAVSSSADSARTATLASLLSHTADGSFRYDSAWYRDVQHLLETAQGTTLDTLARAHVFTPLGMTQSRFVVSSGPPKAEMMGHDGPTPRRPMRRPERPDGAAGLLTSSADYARFVAAVLDGTGLPDTLHRRMVTPQTRVDGWGRRSAAASAPIRWSLGWGLEKTVLAKGDSFSEDSYRLWHWSDNGHFESFVVASPQTGDGFVLLTNGTGGLDVARGLARVLGVAPVDRLLDWLDASSGETKSLRPERTAPRVQALLAQRDTTAALRLSRRTAWAYPTSWRSHVLLSEAYRQSGQTARAREHLHWANAFGAPSSLTRPRLDWLGLERQEADGEAPTDRPAPSRLTGVYGSIKVSQVGDALQWRQRDRASGRLRHVRGTTYATDDPSVRVRFFLEETGSAASLTVLYYGGGQVTHDRTGP